MATDTSLSSAAQFLALLNSKNINSLPHPVDANSVTLGVPSVSGSGKNTNIVVTAVANMGWSGSQTINYDRISLSALLGSPEAVYTMDDTPTVAELVTMFNTRHNTNLVVGVDIDGTVALPTLTPSAVNYTLTALSGSIAYRGTATLSVKGVLGEGPSLTGSNTTGVNFPTNIRATQAIVASNNKIYTLGGNDGTATATTFRSFDLTTNTWASLLAGVAPVLIAKGLLGNGNGKIYHMNTSACRHYTISSNTWVNMPYGGTELIGSNNSSAVWVNPLFYVLGVLESGGTTIKFKSFNPETNIFTNLAIPTDFVGAASIQWHSLTYLDGKIYLFGARIGAVNTNALNVYVYDIAANTWTKKADAPRIFYLASPVVVKNEIYIYGSSTAGNASSGTNTLYKYKPSTDTWSLIASFGAIAGDVTNVVYNDTIYAIGGYNAAGTVTNQVLKIT